MAMVMVSLFWLSFLLLLQGENISGQLLPTRPELFVPEEFEKCKTRNTVGPLQIDHDGVYKDHFLIVSGGVGSHSLEVSDDKKTATVAHGTRAYIANSCAESFSKDVFTQFHLLNRTLEFTTDLSRVGCACNMAVYLVSMPGCGKSWGGDYYCDANGVTGQWCPEIDLMEANKMTFQVAGHKCDTQKSDKCEWTGCDNEGDYHNFYESQEAAWDAIDKSKPFEVATTFIANDFGDVMQMKSTLTQGENVVSWTDDNWPYMNKLTKPITDGMVVVFSLWGGGGGQMAWLDVPPCNGGTSCSRHPAPVSNFKVYDMI